MKLTLEERLDRRESRDEIQNIMGRYVFYRMGGCVRDAAELFSRRDDTEIQMPMGIYRGSDAAERCFVIDHKDDAEAVGSLTIHNVSTPVIEVAEDGKTAKGVWISPGIATASVPDGTKKGLWAWLRYKCDFIREPDGCWKIWHMYKYSLFTVPTDKSWTDDDPMSFMRAAKPKEGAPEPHRSSADEVPTERHEYRKDRQPQLLPEPPLPYKTWE